MPKRKSSKNTDRGVFLSLTSCAYELGANRESLRSRLIAAGVYPARTERGSALFRLRDVLRAWLEPAESDPSRLSPFALRALRLAELAELTLKERSGQLVEIAAVRRDYSVMAQLIAQTLGNIPDIAERHGASLNAVLEIESSIAAARRELVEHLRPTGNADAP